jgi:hypothetical protein
LIGVVKRRERGRVRGKGNIEEGEMREYEGGGDEGIWRREG